MSITAEGVTRRLTRNQIRSFWAAWAGWALDGMDSFIYALVLVPSLRELLPVPGSMRAHPTSAFMAASCSRFS
jgi:hypothetical protein